MTERELISLVSRRARAATGVSVGIGDDAAIVSPPRKNLILTVDSVVEGVHFDSRYFTPEDVGHKALAVNLSDIAAMGGAARYALVSVGLGKKDAKFWEGFYDGFLSLARRHGVALVGGNVSSSRGAFADVTLVGETTRPFLRSGAQPGDFLAVTGRLGGAAAGLSFLKREKRRALSSSRSLALRQLRPTPRLSEAAALSRVRAVGAAIDVSDGLSRDLHRIADASQVGFLVEASQLPLEPEAISRLGFTRALRLALGGGEDYELLVTIRRRRLAAALSAVSRAGGKLTPIGQILPRASGRWIRHRDGKVRPLGLQGWLHR